jgi:hypothetical protein
MARTDLTMWVITDHPRDFPEVYVARRFSLRPGGGLAVGTTSEDVWTSPGLTPLRMVMQHIEGMSGFFSRSPEDDPVVVETWI